MSDIEIPYEIVPLDRAGIILTNWLWVPAHITGDRSEYVRVIKSDFYQQLRKMGFRFVKVSRDENGYDWLYHGAYRTAKEAGVWATT